MNITDIVAISAVRTPMGSFGGTLKDMHSCQIGAEAIKAVVARSGIDASQIDDVILGSCRQAGNGVNSAKTAAVWGGIPKNVPAITLNMACPSGMRAIAMASQQIRLGESEVVLVGGFDSMSTIPFLLKNARWAGFKMGDRKLEDGWSDSIDPVIGQGMGGTAENLVEKYQIPRIEMDEFAARSHEKAHSAWEKGFFNDEVIPIIVPSEKKGETINFAQDETIRFPVDRAKLAKLPAAFKKDGFVTAGNSCGMSDGACALIITSRDKAKALGVKPLFSIVSFSQVCVPNETMGEGPGVSIPLALQRAGKSLDDMDLIEVNEAFAVQILANQKMLNWNPDKLNVNGGAIALGHPTGISGARIVITLYYALKNHNKEFGVAGICGGTGVSMAMVIKRES
jgi:acetyl-CoA C-acetyltransferase